MKRILFVGEHPYSTTGNGNMLSALLAQTDFEKFKVTVYSCTKTDMPPFETPPYTIIETDAQDSDEFGMKKLAQLVTRLEFDVMLSVGIDIWRYHEVFRHLMVMKRRKGFKWGALIPYDLHDVREDYVSWIKGLDFPCVYSQYGVDLLKPYIPHIRYFRPPLNGSDLFKPYSQDDRERVRKDLFHTVPKGAILMGFIGPNQFRKDPHRLLKAFFAAKKQYPNLYMYMHTRFTKGVFNLQQMAFDYGANVGDLVIMNQRSVYTRDKMPDIYNALDMYINTSMQEGLSWTVLEAMLCGVPVIASDSTAHKELLKDECGKSVACTDLSYVPMVTGRGPSWVESRSCPVDAVTEAILELCGSEELRKRYGERGLELARDWVENAGNINELLEEMVAEKFMPKKEGILFIQHSSAGDVLMSTQCFAGLKARHADKPFIYMTQKQYQDIVEGNPYVDEIIDFDENVAMDYEIIYNPHGDRILPGGFNNLDTKLYAMYPYFCKVDPDEIFIQPVKPDVDLPDEYVVIHTTGGSHEFRTYKHMDMAIKGLDYPVVQIGGQDDQVSHVAEYDLRGKLTWRETAWVMKNAKAAVVIDSFPSHLAGALKTPVVVLYGPAPARVTGPRGDESLIINLEPNKLDVCPNLTNCWGDPGAQRCRTPCINTISPMKVRKALKTLLSKQQEAFGI